MALDMAQGAADLVARSRAGDQNAMAIISLVGQNARNEGPGQIKAKVAYNLIKKEIEKETPNIGKEDERIPFPPPPFLEGLTEPISFYPCFARAVGYRRGYMTCVVAIANGPELSMSHITSVLANIKECAASEKGQREAIQVLKHAERIQRVRKGAPIALLSRDAAWELGE